VNEPNKSQLENSPSKPENIKNLLYKNNNKIKNIVEPNKPSQLKNSLSQLENTSTQFIPISININDLVDKYANVNKRENHQNKRDNNYIKKKLIN